MKFLKSLISKYKRFQLKISPQMNLVWGFFLYTIIGFLLLSIPWFHKTDISFLDNLFVSTSAISTTGLATVGVADSYNFFGQLIILILFQVGGIGYMTLTTYYLIFTTKSINSWHSKLLGAEFTLPETIKIKDFVKSVIVYTVIMELLGTICFFFAFTQTGMGFWESVWFSFFHSVSAFCTAGFGLFPDSFESYQNNVLLNTIISVLAIAGSLGFIVITDLWYRVTGKSAKLSFTTKIVVVGFLILLAFGTTIVWFTEPQVIGSDENRLMQSFFQAMTAMTTVGFNTIATGNLSLPILLLVIFLMYIGASPSGTAGGMKITTLIAMFSILKSRVFGEKKINFLGKFIPFERLYVATSSFILYTILIFLFTFLMSFTEQASFDKILFEVASALGTVGLSAGLTSELTAIGKILMIVLMFIGRVGVLTFGFALLARKNQEEDQFMKDDLAV